MKSITPCPVCGGLRWKCWSISSTGHIYAPLAWQPLIDIPRAHPITREQWPAYADECMTCGTVVS